MGAFKKQILDDLYKNNYRDLYNVIDKIDNDVDVANYLSANRAYFDKKFKTKDLEGMPNFRKALYEDLKTGKIDYDKQFGKDWYKKFNEIPLDQIKFESEKQGVPWQKTLTDMQNKATAKLRYDIAHAKGGDISLDDAVALGLDVFGRRTQEAIARGESPSVKDVALDIGQTGLEAMPYGRLYKGANLVGKALTKGASYAAAPFASEAADYVAYDESNPRGNFDLGEATAGTGVNFLGGQFLKQAGAITNRLSGGKYGKTLMNLGEGESRQDSYRNIRDKYIDQQAKSELVKDYWDIAKNDFTEEGAKLPTDIKAKVLEYVDNMDKEATREAILEKLWMGNPVTKVEKAAFPAHRVKLTPNEIRFMQKDEVLRNYLDAPEFSFLKPSEANLRAQEAFKTLLTNKLGTYQEEQGKAFNRVPIVGSYVQHYLDEKAEEEARKADEERILNELRAKNMLHMSR